MDKNHIVEQTKLAFDFIQKLYLETSYFIKEMEGILGQEKEQFQILKPRGYQISTAFSMGLESLNVQQWLVRKGVVCFASKSDIQHRRGRTNTKFHQNLKVIIVRFVLSDAKLDEPEVWVGVVSDIQLKAEEDAKFEEYISDFSSYDSKVFKNEGKSKYEDNYWSIKLNLLKKPLYDITSSEDIKKEIIEPVLTLYKTNTKSL